MDAKSGVHSRRGMRRSPSEWPGAVDEALGRVKGSRPQEAEKVEKYGRRAVIKGGIAATAGVALGLAYVRPAMLSVSVQEAYAASPVPHPECVGATCATFKPCSSANADCVCVTTSAGTGTCTPGSTPCAGLTACGAAPGYACPEGTYCAIDTCCGSPVCVPDVLSESCPATAPAGFKAPAPAAAMTTGPTIGHL